MRERSSLFTILIVGVYAAIDEIHQLFIPGRDCQLGDWMADFLAAIIAVAVIGYIFRHFAKKRAEQNGI
jgi:VanZ family protein